MAFRQCFFKKNFWCTWSDQKSSNRKVLKNFKKTPNCTRWPKELNQKGFPRNIQYRTRPQGPSFSFFGIARVFFGKFFPQRAHLQFFWSFATEWMLKNPKGPPFQFFRHCGTFFSNKRVPNSPILWHFEVLWLFFSLRYGLLVIGPACYSCCIRYIEKRCFKSIDSFFENLPTFALIRC